MNVVNVTFSSFWLLMCGKPWQLQLSIYKPRDQWRMDISDAKNLNRSYSIVYITNDYIQYERKLQICLKQDMDIILPYIIPPCFLTREDNIPPSRVRVGVSLGPTWNLNVGIMS